MNITLKETLSLIGPLGVVLFFAIFATISRGSKSTSYRVWINRLLFRCFSFLFGFLGLMLGLIVIVIPMTTKETNNGIIVIGFYTIIATWLYLEQRPRKCPDCGRKTLYFTSRIVTGFSKTCLTCISQKNNDGFMNGTEQ